MPNRFAARFLTSAHAAAITLLLTSSIIAAQPDVTNPGSIPATVVAPSPTNSSAAQPAPTNPQQAMTMALPVASTNQSGERSSYNAIRVDGPYIAMTFDDGPDAKLTPRLLDLLKERNIHVTFFVLGERVKDHPEILQREVAEGHEIGNHSWDHKALNKLPEGGLQHELADTSELIRQTIEKPVTLMRPPYGATNPRLSRAIEKEYGMKVILWSVDPDDWKDPGPKVVSERIISGWKGSGGAKPGAIILSHDIHKGTIEAMPATLDALLAKGYKFVTVSELIALESKNPAPSPTPSVQKPTKSKKKSA
jgi:peptidoglycan/xylan/chitin deacetylase (PgdA/CDA1 family)